MATTRPRQRDRSQRISRRRYCLRLSNPTPADCIRWQAVITLGNDAPSASKLTFFIVQTEKGEQGTVHYQAYCEFKSKVAWSTIKLIFGNGVHIEASRGNAASNIKYCSKPDTQWNDSPVSIRGSWGMAKRGGQRLQVSLDIQNGMKLEKVEEKYPELVLFNRKDIESGIAMAKGVRLEAPKITILTGLTGGGKSQYCVNTFGKEAWWCPPPRTSGVWWGHYTCNDVCVFDDFHSGWFTLTFLLRLLDSTPLYVEPKNGQVPFNSKHMVFTCNVDPKDWYLHYKGKKEHKDALERRIKDFATIVDCSMEMVPTPRGPVGVPVRVERTEVFKFNADDFSNGQAAGVGDLPYGNYFNNN